MMIGTDSTESEDRLSAFEDCGLERCVCELL
jgi:hypothetical protein